MPPFVPGKRRSPSPAAPPAKRRATSSKTKDSAKREKPTLFDALDTPKTSVSTPEQTKAYLETLKDSDDSSLSDVESDEFEDVPAGKKRKVEKDADQESEEEAEEDEMDWEDAIQGEEQSGGIGRSAADEDIGDLSISLNDDGSIAASAAMARSGETKGPSKRERTIRIRTHCLHVQAMMWHNAIRNSWLNDKELHKILLDGLSEGIRKEIDRWKVDMGMKAEEEEIKGPKGKGKGKRGAKGKGKSQEKRDGRDWGIDADRLEKGAINMSRGDPLLRLLKVLTAYWRKKFTVTAPGLRKQGYMPLKRLAEEMKSWKKDHSNVQAHGERIESRQELRRLAKICEGSRDVGSQLFTALLRALGLEARMVANLQPAGIGWNKNEEALPKKLAKTKTTQEQDDDDSDIGGSSNDRKKSKATPKSSKKGTPTKATKNEKLSKKSGRGNKKTVINLDSDASELSSAPSDVEEDDASIVDVTPSTPKKAVKKYDRDLPFPIYWTEVLLPVSNIYIPVDPIVLSTVASNQELLSTFEPRGKRADQAKQVMCYTIAHSQDGSAKDVTVRYLKKHQLPGRTKGYRMPVEKIKVYNKRGKVKKYEDYDWFKSVMSSYDRPHRKRTTADDVEEATDLKPFKPVSEKPKLEVESLQWYKQSAEYVLERHLRREEALLPGSESVKTFASGKGEKAMEEPVYRRSDVVACKTAESWHKEGRQIKVGEQPLKMVPVRAVTMLRKREMEEAERETGEKLKQGLFSYDQCEWIIPPPIKDGIIPRNAFGNMDVYTPSMVPKGAVHIPLKGTAKICRRLKIDYAEACTGFEFGKQRAVPVLTGVVVANGNEDAVIDAWEIDEEEKRRKEDVKKEQLCLHLWRKFLMGMRIVERMRVEYADSAGKGEEINPFVRKQKEQQQKPGQSTNHDTPMDDADVKSDDGSVAGGGFLLPEDEERENEAQVSTKKEDYDMDGGGGFVIDTANDEQDTSTVGQAVSSAPVTPMSLQSAYGHAKASDGPSEDEEDDPPVLPKTRSKQKKQPAQAKARTKATPQPKPKTPRTTKTKPIQPPSESEQEPELSEQPYDLSDDSLEDSALSDDTTPPPRQQFSKVVVTPGRSTRASLAGRSATQKKTPVKSRYFEQVDDEDEEAGQSEDSEPEVVKPRTTTARTRGKR